MAVLISLTPKPVGVSTTGPSAEGDFLDVTGLRVLRMSLRVMGAKITGPTPAIDFSLEGSMIDKDHGWVTLALFPTVTASTESVTVVVEHPMRYLRWNLVTLTDCTGLYFDLDGIAWT